MKLYPIQRRTQQSSLSDTSFSNQMSCLMERGIIKIKRDTTMTHLRVLVNILVAAMLGSLYVGAGNEGSRVLDNYNLLFAILIHHSMTTMMLTVLTCKLIYNPFSLQIDNAIFLLLIAVPTEMNLLLKEHFNRWYSLKAYFTSLTILDLPITVCIAMAVKEISTLVQLLYSYFQILSCFLFTVIIYIWTAQPLEWSRFSMFFTISLLIVWVGQGMGLMIGAWFDVVVSNFNMIYVFKILIHPFRMEPS